MSFRVLVAAGGTGGHVYPALAIADELTGRGHSVRFSGGRRVEAELVPRAGYELHQLPARPLPRRPSVQAVGAGFDLVRGIRSARRLVRRERVDVVVGMGGYDSLAPSLGAGSVGVGLVLHEQNGNLSLAHRVSVRRAQVLALSLPLADGAPSRQGLRVELTGNPLRAAVRELAEADPDERARRRDRAIEGFGLSQRAATILVVGGSLGAQPLNDGLLRCGRAWAGRDDIQVVHVTGRDHEAAVREAWSQIDLRTEVFGFIERIEEAYACADVVVARSGGSVVAELAACGLASVLVPGPWSPRRDQTVNARVLAEAGAALLVPQEQPDLVGELRSAVDELVADGTRRAEMEDAARRLGRPDAAARVADLVEWTGGRRR